MPRRKSQRGEKTVRKMHPNSLANLQPFKEGDDPRRNKGGVPKDVKELQALIDEIFAEEIADGSGRKMDKLRVALNRLLLGKNPMGAIHVLDRRFGKVQDHIDVTSGGEKIAPETMKPSEIAERVAALLKIKDANGN